MKKLVIAILALAFIAGCVTITPHIPFTPFGVEVQIDPPQKVKVGPDSNGNIRTN